MSACSPATHGAVVYIVVDVIVTAVVTTFDVDPRNVSVFTNDAVDVAGSTTIHSYHNQRSTYLFDRSD